MASDPRSRKPGDEGSTRKGYHSPELRIYGDIRAITQTSTGSSTRDGSGPKMKFDMTA